MTLINSEQLWGILVFFIGIGLLNLCSRWEREDREKLKDVKYRFEAGVADKVGVAPSKTRGTLMVFFGFGLSMVGIALFLMNITVK